MVRLASLAALMLATSATPKGWPASEPVKQMQLGQGQTTAVGHPPKKIVRVVSGDPTIITYMRFGKAVPTVGLRAGRAGVTNLLVWTSDMKVHTYLVTVR